MAITDPRSKFVLAKLIDKVSTSYPLHSLFTDLSPATKKGESIDIPTRSAITVEQASNSAGPLSMTTQSNVPVSNTLVTDQHYGAIVQVPRLNAIFDLEGTWSDQEADNIKIELEDYVDQVHWDDALFTGAYNTGATANYWVNQAGASLTQAHVGEAQATMLNQKGARKSDLVWVFNPWGMESVRQLPSWQANAGQVMSPEIGIPTVGMLNGIRVVESQSVRDQRELTGVASSIDGSGEQTLTVSSGHGLVAGMTIAITGYGTADHNQSSVSITETTATTIVVANAAASSTDTAGTVTCNLTMNGLLNPRWAFSRVQQVPDVRIVANTGQISDELQADVIFGYKTLAGACVGLGSPRQAL